MTPFVSFPSVHLKTSSCPSSFTEHLHRLVETHNSHSYKYHSGKVLKIFTKSKQNVYKEEKKKNKTDTRQRERDKTASEENKGILVECRDKAWAALTSRAGFLAFQAPRYVNKWQERSPAFAVWDKHTGVMWNLCNSRNCSILLLPLALNVKKKKRKQMTDNFLQISNSFSLTFIYLEDKIIFIWLTTKAESNQTRQASSSGSRELIKGTKPAFSAGIWTHNLHVTPVDVNHRSLLPKDKIINKNTKNELYITKIVTNLFVFII